MTKKIRPETPFKKLNQQSLPERVRHILEEAILARDLSVIDRLPKEIELSESFGVSRTVVREALQNLKAEGLIESRVGSGTFIAEYPAERIQRAFERFHKLHTNLEGLADYADLRMVVEVEAVTRVTSRGGPGEVKILKEILAEMSRDDCSPERYRELDLNFHFELVKASGNRLFCMILQPIQEHGIKILAGDDLSRETLIRNHKLNTEEHAAIVAAIERKDVETAVKVTRVHLGRGVESLRKKALEPKGSPGAA